MDLSGLAEGMEAGLSHFNGGIDYANIGVAQGKSERILKYEENGKVSKTIVIPKNTSNIWFRSSIGYNGLNTFAYSLDGINYTQFGNNYQLRQGNFRGDNIGIYCFNNEGERGFVDVDWFHYEFKNK
jgi:hypothetical protein